MRAGKVFRRCGRCSRRVDGKRCGACGYGSSSWAFVVDVAPAGPPRRQRSRQGFATKAEALAAMAELQTEAATGRAVEPSKVSTGDYLDRWLSTVRPPAMSETGHATATVHVRAYLAPRLGAVPLQALDRTTVKAVYADLRAGGGRHGGELAAATVHRVHATLNSALAAAVEDGLLRTNPAARAHTAPRRQAPVAVWDAAELRTFLAWAREGSPWSATWHLAAFSGLRRSELCRLTWRDVDLVTATVTVRVSKSDRGRRTVDVDADTARGLRDHRRRWLERRLAAGLGDDPDAAVFCGDDPTRPLRPDTLTKAWTRAVRNARRDGVAVPVVTLHGGTRHTHATLMLLAGVPLHVVSRRLGHSRESFTAEKYAHVLPQQDASAAATFAALVAEGGRDSVSEP